MNRCSMCGAPGVPRTANPEPGKERDLRCADHVFTTRTRSEAAKLGHARRYVRLHGSEIAMHALYLRWGLPTASLKF